MNRDEKAAVVDEVAAQIKESEAIIAIDYRGISVSQVAELRAQLGQADATLRVIKNRLTQLSIEKAGAENLKQFLEGPTAFTFIRGDAAAAAKALATFRKEHDLLEFKGGTMNGDPLSVDEIMAISKLPSRDMLNQQLVGVLAFPIGGLARTLNQLIQGLAVQLGQIAEQGLVTGEAPAEQAPAEPASAEEVVPSAEAEGADAEEAPAEEAEAPAGEEAPAEEAEAPAAEEAPAEEAEAPAEEPAADEAPAEAAEAPAEETQASGDEPAENDESDAPSEGEETKEG